MYPHLKPAFDTVPHNGALTKVVRVVVNNGPLSCDNGAVGPLNGFFDIAKLSGIAPELGGHYGHDCLLVPESDWPAIQSLLKEMKLVYRLAGPDQPWQNVLTQKVADQLGVTV